jgi:hypothetical protein
MIGQDSGLPGLGQVDAQDRVISRNHSRNAASLPLRSRSPATARYYLTHGTSSSRGGIPSPSSHQEDVLASTATVYY